MGVLTTILLCISAAALGLQVVLMRALSIGHWHHFAYLIISTALLGFGSSGTLITAAQRSLRTRYLFSLWFFSLAMGISIPATFQTAQQIPFDQLQLMWDPGQLLFLLGCYLLFFIPFFFAGACICLIFTVFARHAHRLYFFNMIGSGLGAGGILILMYDRSPEHLLLLISAMAFFSAVVTAFRISFPLVAISLITAGLVTAAYWPGSVCGLRIRISEHKALAYYPLLPNAEILATRYSPLARLDIVQAPAVRYAPGLSLQFRGPLPGQALLISDADSVSALNRFETLQDLQMLDYVTAALPYHLVRNPDVCIIGSGGGTDIAQALSLHAARITAVEMNPQIIELLRGPFRHLVSSIYDHPQVFPIITEGRNFLQTAGDAFDIIQISLLDSFTTSGAGLYTLNESHLYTIEAVNQALDRLTPDGLLCITRSLKTPPRDSLKALATIVQAMQMRGIGKPSDHIAMIRSWATATIVASARPLPQSTLHAVRRFCRQRGFDLIHLPDLQPGESNQYHILDQPVYYQSARHILSDQAEEFYRTYAYNIRPATDDRPYFFDFFKWAGLPHIIHSLPEKWLPYAEWGYVILFGTLLQAIIVSLLLIILPLAITQPVKSVSSGKSTVLIYFLLLGLAFMFLEMGFIQKLTLLIGDPVSGVAVTLLGFLVFSGCGALVSGRWSRSPERSIQTAVTAIIITAAIELVLFNAGFDPFFGLSRTGRIVSSLLSCAPLAFFMGIPFPAALSALDRHKPALVPWAWGINGFASVTAAVLGTCLAISLGFTILTLIALICYAFAALIAKRVATIPEKA